MWFFDKKDPAKEYEQHKQTYLDKAAVARNKPHDVRLRMFKADQEGQLAKLNVEVKEGCLKLGDLLEIEYSINNKLGISDAIAEVKEIYQIHNDGGFFSKDELVSVKEAYEQDLSLRVAGYVQKQIEQSKWDKLQGKFDVGAALSYESKQKEYDQVLKLRMSKVDPLFSPTAFYNSMRNKLYSIVFAENVVALRSFADEDFDVALFYEKFRNVIDIDIQEIKTKNFEKSDSYIITDVIMSVMVLRYDKSGDTAEWSKEKVTMSFVKHIDNKTRNIFEPSIIQCKCCGGSYSLYEGKACSYCGNDIDYPMYDWLLIDLKLEVEPNK